MSLWALPSDAWSNWWRIRLQKGVNLWCGQNWITSRQKWFGQLEFTGHWAFITGVNFEATSGQYILVIFVFVPFWSVSKVRYTHSKQRYFKEYNSIEKDKFFFYKISFNKFCSYSYWRYVHHQYFFFETLIRVKRKPRILIIIFFSHVDVTDSVV